MGSADGAVGSTAGRQQVDYDGAKVPREVSEMKIGRILRLSSLTGNGIKH